MGPWALTHTPLKAFTNYNSNFLNKTGSWKNNVVLLGYQWFAYSFIPKTISLSVHEQVLNNTTAIYPNPVSNGILNVDCHQCDVNILNGTGQIVKSISVRSENQRQLDVSDLVNGVCFISINNTNKKNHNS